MLKKAEWLSILAGTDVLSLKKVLMFKDVINLKETRSRIGPLMAL